MPTLPVIHFPQQHEADCLAACAYMVLTHVNVPIRYNRLLRLLQVDTEEAGASFYHLSNLTTLGVDIVVGDGHMQLLEAHLDQRIPVIASVDTRELTYWNGLWRFHAVVVTGIEGSQITINDPAFVTSQIVPAVQFESAWLEREYVYATIKVRR